uniref:PDZ domain-containing protein n=1 Tax=Parascaris univalens TaxID=6257 RepID=A0A915BMZ0_PARUN
MAEKKKRRRRSLDGVDETQERLTMSTESSSAQRRRSYPQADLSGEVLKRISKIPKVDGNAVPSNRNCSCKAVCVDMLGATLSQPNSKRSSRKSIGSDVPHSLLEDKTVTIICPGGVAPKLRISKTLQVLKVQESSLAANRLDPGDIVHKVNGEIVVNRKEFYRMMNDIAKDPDCQAVRIDFKRPKRLQKLSAKEIFVELPKAFEILPGYEYFLGFMTLFPGCKIGIHIKSYNQKVYVSSTDPNSISSWTFLRGDAILSVEGTPVTAVQDTSQKIITALKSKKSVKSVIERPSVPATYRLANFALLYNKKNEIDPKMADDVIEICRRELDQWRSKKTPVALPGILRKKTQKEKQPQKYTVAIAPKSTETSIASESINLQWLQRVPERCSGDEYEKVAESLLRRSTRSPADPASKRKSFKGKGISRRSLKPRRYS